MCASIALRYHLQLKKYQPHAQRRCQPRNTGLDMPDNQCVQNGKDISKPSDFGPTTRLCEESPRPVPALLRRGRGDLACPGEPSALSAEKGQSKDGNLGGVASSSHVYGETFSSFIAPAQAGMVDCFGFRSFALRISALCGLGNTWSNKQETIITNFRTGETAGAGSPKLSKSTACRSTRPVRPPWLPARARSSGLLH